MARRAGGLNMDPNGFRMFMASYAPVALPSIGAAFGGGFYAGLISHTANGVATHALIVAPRATGAFGGGYPQTGAAWKTSNTLTAGATSPFNGRANTDAIITAGIANHPATQLCVNLTIGGYTDWYLPARYELDIAYFHLKPTTDSNNTAWGINNYSVSQRTSNWTAGTPAQTSVTAFQSPSGSERFETANTWSSTDNTALSAFSISFASGRHDDAGVTIAKTSTGQPIRAFRKIIV